MLFPNQRLNFIFLAIIQLKEEFPSLNLDFIRQGTSKPFVTNFNQVPPLEKLLETTSDSFFENKEVNGHGKDFNRFITKKLL